MSEDAAAARYLAAVLRHNGIRPWLDKNDLTPGTSWKTQLRSAIQSGNAFIPMFSRAWETRQRTVANDELMIAIDELRKRPMHRAWFIPLRINECTPHDYDIGPNLQLSDIQRADVPEQGWPEAMTRLLKVLDVVNPDLAVGAPLGPNLPARVEITGGEIIVRGVNPPNNMMHQMVFYISGGHCSRTEGGKILAFIKSRSPQADLQLINEQFGLADFYAECADEQLSSDPDNPSTFKMEREVVFPAGTPAWHPELGRFELPLDLGCHSFYSVGASLVGNQASGDFGAVADLSIGTTVEIHGDYWFDVRPAYGPSES